jgi:DNA-binding NarL/FixJ family response regulator
MNVRVLIVDDHELVRTAVSAALHDFGGIDVVGTCVDGLEALAAVEHARPDVVLMDLSMPRLGGVDATRRLMQDHPDLRVVILTSASGGWQTTGALAAGAVSVVYKNADIGEVAAAVRAAVPAI